MLDGLACLGFSSAPGVIDCTNYGILVAGSRSLHHSMGALPQYFNVQKFCRWQVMAWEVVLWGTTFPGVLK